MSQAEGERNYFFFFFAYCSDLQNNTKKICALLHENILGSSRMLELFNKQKWTLNYPKIVLQTYHIIFSMIARVIPKISLQKLKKTYETFSSNREKY